MVILGVLAVLLVFGYFVFTGTSAPAPVTTDGTDTTADQNMVGQDVITLAQKLDDVNIDDSIFTGAVFLSLIDRDIPIASENQGRPNPFATIGIEGGGTGGTNVAGTLKPPLTPPR